MNGWDRYLSQVMRAYNSTHHSITGISPHMMLTGHDKALPLTFSYPEYEGKKISPQVYVRDETRRQQELNDLDRRKMQQAQAKHRKRVDKKAAGAKIYSVKDCVCQSYQQKNEELARLAVVERKDVRPQGEQCLDSGRKPREHELHK